MKWGDFFGQITEEGGIWGKGNEGIKLGTTPTAKRALYEKKGSVKEGKRTRGGGEGGGESKKKKMAPKKGRSGKMSRGRGGEKAEKISKGKPCTKKIKWRRE